MCLVELGVTLREPLPARFDQLFIARPLRRKKAKALEHCTITKRLGVADERVRIRFRISKVVPKAALDMPKASAGSRIGKQIDDRPVLVRNGHPGAAAPQRPCAENGCLLDVFEGEWHSLNDDLTDSNRAGG